MNIDPAKINPDSILDVIFNWYFLQNYYRMFSKNNP